MEQTSKLGLTTTTCVLCVRPCSLALPPLTLLLLHNHLLPLYKLLLAFVVFPLSFLLPIHLHLIIFTLIYHLFLHLFCLTLHLNNPQISSSSSLENQEIFLGLCTVGIVNDQTSRKPWFHSCSSNHLQLMLSIRIKLQDGSSSNTQTLIQRLKKFTASFERVIVFPAGHA